METQPLPADSPNLSGRPDPKNFSLMPDKFKTSRPPGLQLAKRSLSFLKLTKRVLKPRHKCVVIASMPKSASTYLTKTLARLPGIRECWPVHKGGRVEQNLYLPALIDLYGHRTVSQIHLRATSANLALIDQFDIKPVVLIRNIFDAVVSWHDHMRNESTIGCMLYADDRFFKLTTEEQYDMIIDLAVPWYFSFMVSWLEADAQGKVSPLWLDFPEVTTSTRDTLRKVVDHTGISCSDADLDACILVDSERNANSVRFNKGVEGRGLETLSTAQAERIRSFARYYPGLDFTRMGIPPSENPPR